MQKLYWSLNVKNCPKLNSIYLKENYILIIRKTKYSSKPNNIFKSAKKFYEKLYTKKKPPKLPLLTFLVKCLTEVKAQMNNFTFVRLKFL